jgi:IKI3 family
MVLLCTMSNQGTLPSISEWRPCSRRGTAAVVDGARLLLTPLQHELVPPPMASVVTACPAPVQSVSFRTATDQREVGAP